MQFGDAKQALEAIGQSHVLSFWSELSDGKRSALLDQIASLNLLEIQRLVREYVTNRPTLTLLDRIDPPSWYGADGVSAGATYDMTKFKRIGEDIIRRGKVAVFIVAGGQGSRLGWEGPKGTFPATPLTGKSLFQIFAEGIHAAQIKYGKPVPLYVMTSPLNHGDTVAYFNSHEQFGLGRDAVRFFPQGVMPSFDACTGRMLLAGKGEIAMNPDGHGGSLRALWTSGAIDDMKDRGIEVISYIQVDNPHVRVVDPLFIGLHVGAPDSSAEMSSKMLPKTGPREKLGNFCRVNGRTTVIEYSDLPDELAERRNERGDLIFGAGSIAIHCLSVEFVERLNRARGGFSLPYHRAEKKIPYVDVSTGRLIEPSAPNGVKLESFVFDALPLCESSIVLETDRIEEFAPIKNATGVDSVETSRALQTERAARWLEKMGVHVSRKRDGSVDAVIEISPLTAVEAGDLAGADLPAEIQSGERVIL